MTPLPPATTAQVLVRVLALPVGRRHTYYHIMQPPPPPPSSAAAPSMLRRALGRATALWDGMGSSERPPGSWQRRVHAYGSALMDRAVVPDERALKAVDPARPADAALLLHPAAAGSALECSGRWAAHVAGRVPLHRRAMLGWLAVSPLTAPFMIVPIVPNLPFFYCCWRAWSHYEAFVGARYLHALPLRAEPSPLLDDAYDGAAELSPERVQRVVKAFDLPPHSALEILRAVEHAHAREKKQESQS